MNEDKFTNSIKELLASSPHVPERTSDAVKAGKQAFIGEVRSARLAQQSSVFAAFIGWLNTRPIVQAWKPQNRLVLAKALIAIGLATIVLTSGGLATASASRSALPGNFLYPIKINLENAQTNFTRNEVKKANLHLQHTNKRMEEIITLNERNNYQPIPTAISHIDENMELLLADLEILEQKDIDKSVDMESELGLIFLEHSSLLSEMSHDEDEIEVDDEKEKTKEQMRDLAQKFDSFARKMNIKITGKVENIEGNLITVKGRVFILPEGTLMEDELSVGDVITLDVIIKEDSTLSIISVNNIVLTHSAEKPKAGPAEKTSLPPDSDTDKADTDFKDKEDDNTDTLDD